ncbi:putative polyketide synthase [Lepidopterella palustris CBS 459.81]|uniref:Putative polyketide synthase n=1 Tax=Lepidopterella palustris CBS 459.81 TaxID=1314670 RepID=A0A8E2JA59_9PEZI|nr:putative polyketide synthase [Lepidopterella palustris CBS 459.81]
MGFQSRSKFDAFDRIDLVYHVVHDHPLQASILTPKELSGQSSKQLPVVVFWHGGGFIVGDRLYEPWWSEWLIEFALSQSVMIITADYRLMPEATGADILDDIEAFWNWLYDTLPLIADSWTAQPDLNRILCVGQSSGGCMAVQSALLRPDMNIKAIVSMYAPLHRAVPYFTVPQPRKIMGAPPFPPRQAEAKIRSYIKSMPPEAVRTTGDPTDMWELLRCILQQGWLPRLIDARPDARLDIFAMMEQTNVLPPIWFIHGEQDSVVPPICSTAFIEKMETVLPRVPVLFSKKAGEHAFEATLTMKEPWIAEGCKFLMSFW